MKLILSYSCPNCPPPTGFAIRRKVNLIMQNDLREACPKCGTKDIRAAFVKFD